MSQQPVVDRFLDAVRLARIDDCEVWAPGAILDATVPNWRFHPPRSRPNPAGYPGWVADPGWFESLRRSPVEGGEIVDFLLCWTEDGVPHAAHHVHWLDVVDDQITADVVVCGGRWPAGLLAEMEAADA